MVRLTGTVPTEEELSEALLPGICLHPASNRSIMVKKKRQDVTLRILDLLGVRYKANFA
jgi:hypothetical protein